MVEKEVFEETLFKRYQKGCKELDKAGMGSLKMKFHLLSAIWSTRYWDLVLVENKSPKLQKSYEAFVEAEAAIQGMDTSKSSTFIYYNAIYLLARFFNTGRK